MKFWKYLTVDIDANRTEKKQMER